SHRPAPRARAAPERRDGPGALAPRLRGQHRLRHRPDRAMGSVLLAHHGGQSAMNRPVVLISLESPHSFWRLSAEHERALSASFPAVGFRTAPEEAVPHQLAEAHVYVGWAFKPSWLFGAPRLRWIASPAAGTDHLPVAEARSVGVALTRSYGFHGRPMAEHAMGLVLGFSRGLFTSQRVQRNRAWWKDDLAEEFFDLAGATMTIVGCGSVGRHLAQAARAFGMNVIGVRRTPPA